MCGLSQYRLLLQNESLIPLLRVNDAYVRLVPFVPALPLMPSLKRCEGSATSPIRALDFPEGVDHSEALPKYAPPATGWTPIHRSSTPVLASQVIGRRLHQVHEGLMHMQRCRELFAAAMRGVDDLVYDPEGDRLLLRGKR